MRHAPTLIHVCAGLSLLAVTCQLQAGNAIAQTRRSPARASTPTASPARFDVVTGQVFIVTKGRENVKLGLVTISLLPLDATVKRVDEKHAEAQRAREDYQPEIDRARAALAEAVAARDSTKRAKEHAAHMTDMAQEGINEAVRRGGSKRYNEAVAAFSLAFREKTRAEKAADDAFMAHLEAGHNLDRVTEGRSQWASGKFFLGGLPTATATTQTDADGKFTLRVPRVGRFALAAQAERQVGDITEEYSWLIRLPDEARQGAPVFLSNETLTTGESPLSLVKTVK